MAWTTPKTDWTGSRDADGVYSGDRFKPSDWNRIYNNAVALNDILDARQEAIMMRSSSISVGTYINQLMVDRLLRDVNLLIMKFLGDDRMFDEDVSRFFNWQTLNMIEGLMAEAYAVGGAT